MADMVKLDEYEAFLRRKRLVVPPSGIDDPPELHPSLFPHQRDCCRWALRVGKAALFEAPGLGKTRQEIEWARVVADATQRPVLILTPLAVAPQFVDEAVSLDYEVTIASGADDIGRGGVYVANYEKLHRFDADVFGGVAADESSIMKSIDGRTRQVMMMMFAETPFKLSASATPAPNDHMELGSQSEWLGAMSRAEMLATFFVHDGGSTQDWRLKGHATDDFWSWVASWAVAMNTPSDLGYPDDGYILPPREVEQISVKEDTLATALEAGVLFLGAAKTLTAQRAARRATLDQRVALAAELAAAEPDEPWVFWCGLNKESAALTKSIPDAVEVSGSMKTEEKERRLMAFSRGEVRVLVTKASIAGHGMNWQHCARQAFVGIGHSYEQFYQATRRLWRFGQTRPVHTKIIISEREGPVLRNIERKQAAADEMMRGMIRNMADITRENLTRTGRTMTCYSPTVDMVVPEWLRGSP